MTRSTAYRVQTNSAPMAGQAPIHPMPRPRLHTHWREILAWVAVCAGLFIFATLAAIAGGIA